jgi:hypothetical protein
MCGVRSLISNGMKAAIRLKSTVYRIYSGARRPACPVEISGLAVGWASCPANEKLKRGNT